ncbi:hypothetical protein [Synechococcus elongatus]|uniref:Uncharacterized protein n=1 Tax=Synechococcus elongatus PCC 11802 TaxID=2283154 RepID=A0AAT9JX23_SYNEL|nr:hypothetical protein [Synechococcus elongatus]
MSDSLDLDQILQVLSQSPDFGLEACRNFAQFLIKQIPDYDAAHQLMLWCDRKQAAKAEQ